MVASLLDKPPNLGGLCRTCEIFNVEKFVVDSLAVIQEPTFSSLALTAHQWLPMEEVKNCFFFQTQCGTISELVNVFN